LGNAYNIFASKPELERTIGRHKWRWQDIIYFLFKNAVSNSEFTTANDRITEY
jgi:hypothetical protein